MITYVFVFLCTFETLKIISLCIFWVTLFNTSFTRLVLFYGRKSARDLESLSDCFLYDYLVMNSEGSASSVGFDEEESSASTAGPPPDSPPITGRFDNASWPNMGETSSSQSEESSLLNSFSAQLRRTQKNSRAQLRLNSSIFQLGGRRSSQSIASGSASPTLSLGPTREWGRSFIVRPNSSAAPGRGHRSGLTGAFRPLTDLDRSALLAHRQGSIVHYGFGGTSQEICRGSIYGAGASTWLNGSPLQSPKASYSHIGHSLRPRISPAVAVARYVMGGTWVSTASRSDLCCAFNALKSYIATKGKPLILGTESHPLEIKQCGILGAGGFAKVYIGLDTVKGELLAIKEMSIENVTDVQTLNAIEEEFALLRSIRHPNIINYHFFEHSKSQKVCRIVMELLAGNSTMHLLQRFGPLTEIILRKIARHLLHAISFVHHEGILHRDIKPANILVSHTGVVKLCDFGCSKRVSELSKATSCIIGTPVYMAPELIKGVPHQKSDIWSMGCSLFELATGLLPWYHSKVKDNLPLMFYITTTSETPLILPPDSPTELSSDFMNFLNLCFTRDIQKRPDALELLRHPWITEKRGSFNTPASKFQSDIYHLGNPSRIEKKYSSSVAEESKMEEELEEEERREETETLCQQELEDVCVTIAIDRCCQLMNYRYPSPLVSKPGEETNDEGLATASSTSTLSVGKHPVANSVFDFASSDSSPDQSLLNDEFVFQHPPPGVFAGNFVLPSDVAEVPMKQCLRLNEDGKLCFATLPDEQYDGNPDISIFRSPSVDSSTVFSKSYSSQQKSPRKAKSTSRGKDFSHNSVSSPTDFPSSLRQGRRMSKENSLDNQSSGRWRTHLSRSSSSSTSPSLQRSQGDKIPVRDYQSDVSSSVSPKEEPFAHNSSSTSFPVAPSSQRFPESARMTDGKLHTSFCVNGASGKELNVELEVDMCDVHLQMVNNQPNYIVAFNEKIRSQISNKLQEAAAVEEVKAGEDARTPQLNQEKADNEECGTHGLI